MLRLAGLNGLRGVIKKTVSDDLQVNIWDETHMEKIIPSLLYNIQDQETLLSVKESNLDQCNPASIAEDCLRELVGRATYYIKNVVKPILKHFDFHHFWEEAEQNEFASYIFKIIMYSILNQYGYAVIQMLMAHLDERSQEKGRFGEISKIKTGIVIVISDVVGISAADTFGPSVLENISSLLKHLRSSIKISMNNLEVEAEEKNFQATVINTLGMNVSNLI